MNRKRATELLKRYWPAIAVLAIIILSIHIRMLDYRWPYLRNIDSYVYFRQMDSIVQNGGVLPSWDYLPMSPNGSPTGGLAGNVYVYTGSYSYMFFNTFFPDMQLWQFLIWFPPLIVALAAIPLYYIGRTLYDRKAGVVTAAFALFDPTLIARTLAGDPDNDTFTFLVPLVIIALFLLIDHRLNEKKRFDRISVGMTALLSVLGLLWFYTWAGAWFVFPLIYGYIILKFINIAVRNRNIRISLSQIKNIALVAIAMTAFLVAIVAPIDGPAALTGSVSSALGFSELKSEEGRTFPNVYVSVAELQSSNNFGAVVQKTSALNLSNPFLFFTSPFFLTILCFLYLAYSVFKTGRHFNAFTMLLIWFVGFFFASLIAVRFAGFLTVPLAIGAGIFISKIYKMAFEGEKLED